MLRLLTDELRVVVTPTRIGVLRITLGRPSGEIKAYDLGSNTNENVFATLADAFKADFQRSHGVKTRVILSDHYVRYLVLPWQEALSSDDEWLNYAVHAFRAAYGSTAENWTITLSAHSYGSSIVAAAIDMSVHTMLLSAVKDAKLRLVSMEPHLMRVFNKYRRKIHHRDLWLATVEEGCLCIARINNGQWSSLASLRLDNSEAQQPAVALLREIARHPQNSANQIVYLHVPRNTLPSIKEVLGKTSTLISLAEGDFPGSHGEIQRLALC